MRLVCVTLALVGLDIVTGVLAAASEGGLSSKVARHGLMHKSAYLACILLALILDNAQLVIEVGLPVDLEGMVCGYICMIEVLSITENIARLNPELRDSLVLRLFQGTGQAQQDGTGTARDKNGEQDE